MTNITQWAIRHGITPAAMGELYQLLGTDEDIPRVTDGKQSEAGVQQDIRLEASKAGCRLWRNNVGALKDERGVPVRYGLCNESKEMNKRIKSSDLIGIRPVLITPEMVGHRIGQFLAREIKEPGWKYTGKGREEAQLKFGQLVISLGGDFAFANGEGSI